MKRLLLLLVVAGCAQSNDAILEELEQDSRRRNDTQADRLAKEGFRPLPVRGEARALRLPLLSGKPDRVRIAVNGVAMPCVLDTGSSGVWLPAALARKARIYLPPGEEREALAPGYTRTGRLGVVEKVALGGVAFGPGVVVVPTGRVRSNDYGIVGCSVLSHFRATFDYRRREVRLEPHGGAPYTENLFTTIRINGKPYLLMVDSGANRIYLDPWAARELGLIPEAVARAHAKKADRPWRTRFTWVRLEKVEVAGRVFLDMKAGVVNTFEGLKTRDGRRPAGLLGFAGFGKLAWTLDYGTRRLSVE